ncbi:RagB/SusD family nutrient uptake outer membrane protein [Sphingobacteriaceae bacterium]|nr:RagB/SusD family nutrient uptake outer membrane protein [Sphingobacteriaceae bacterium]
MKYSYIKAGLLITILSISVVACKKKLEEYNPSGLTDQSVYTTPAGFESLVNGAYSFQRWWYGKVQGYAISEMGTDLWASGSADQYPELTQYTNLQGVSEPVTTEWSKLYAAVNMCNTGLAKIDGSGLSAALIKTRTAELKFLRAFYYWHIVEMWGGVNFSTVPTEGIVTTANKTPVEKFYEQIFADLTDAIAGLPNTTADYGRATKPAAEAFMARMCITRGRHADAITYANNVITKYTFSLLPNYADLWKMSNLQNKEIVYAVNYSSNLLLNDRTDPVNYPTGDGNGSNNGHLFFVMKYDDQPGMARDINGGRPYNRWMPSRFLLDLFTTGDTRYDASFNQVWYSNSATRPAGMALGDTALFATKKSIAVKSTKYKTFDRDVVYNANGSAKNRLQYVALKKFMDPTRTSVNEQQSARDAYVIRLPEMYLIIAEANLALGNTAAAATAINTVRQRAAGGTNVLDITAADVTLDFILDERAREFAGEQLRWFDLKRTNTLVSRVQAHNPDVAAKIQSYHIVRPIPQSQIDAVTNKGEFSQNPGYQ